MRILCFAVLLAVACGEPAQRPEWTLWVQANHQPIRSLTDDDDFSDLAFLEPTLRGRRIVQLGENGHGVAEFSLLKVRLIKYLHAELGYEVVAFESGLYECQWANQLVGRLGAATVMRNCLFGIWHTEEVLSLFDYISEARSSDRPLQLAGFDVINSGSGWHQRPEFFRDLIEPFDPDYAAHAFGLDSLFLHRAITIEDREYIESHEAELVADFEALAAFLTEHRDEIAGAARTDPARVEFAAQVARSAAAFIRQGAADVRDHTSPEASEIRDRGMADNLEFIAERLYPGKKIIVWAHNAHVRHDGLAVQPYPARTMGSWLAERRGEELYTIGLYMYRGHAARNYSSVYEVARIPAGSLESMLSKADAPWHFLDLSGAQLEPGASWMFTPSVAMLDGSRRETLVPRDQYDGIVFIDSVSPPHYR
ncbi:MAG: erythromycin esterase family protein [Gemmatimonadales bacterium]|jgi:erythromycin esterase